MNSKFKFHTFDAMRFFSFLIVFFSHIPFNLFPKNLLTVLDGRGNIGVYFFFTLSGFLITYILLCEKVATNNINFKKFIIRRVLRIWPLFYLMILFAFFSSYIISFLKLPFTNFGYNPNWILSCLFLENYQAIIHNQFANVSPLPVMWSLCVEEHFYIIWGLMLYSIKIKNLPIVIFLLLVIGNTSRYFFLINNLMPLDILTNIDFFMFGAIPAYLYVIQKEKTVGVINSVPKLIKGIILIITILFVFFSGLLELNRLLETMLFGILYSSILFVFLPEKNYFRIGAKNIISKLGMYTYGLYLTHIIAISFVKQLFIKTNINFDNYFILYTTITLLLTILASYLSYNIIEKPFLRIKGKF